MGDGDINTSGNEKFDSLKERNGNTNKEKYLETKKAAYKLGNELIRPKEKNI